MKLTIRDPEVLRRIGLVDLLTYLRASGWRDSGRSFRNSSIWIRTVTVGDDAEILIPSNADTADYANRISDALSILEGMEQRSQIEILQDLTYVSADVIRIRLPATDGPNGSISIDEGVTAVSNARSMMFAAASAAISPRRVLGSRRPGSAIDYMRDLRLGQTERGSFVITIISRVAPQLSANVPSLTETFDEPFPRQVIKTLETSLFSIDHAASMAASTGSFEDFERSVSVGVSANLCESIVGMCKADRSEVTISFSWASSRPLSDRQGGRIVFRQDSLEIIGEAARLFRENSPLEEVRVLAVVVALHREQNTSIGEVSVNGLIQDTPRTIVLRLDGNHYNIALDAHRERRPITFTADISREGRRYKGTNVRDLEIIQAD